MNLIINLKKREFAKASVTYPGHGVGIDMVRPNLAKVESIMNLPVQVSKKKLMHFLGKVGNFRKFCKKFLLLLHL